MNDGPLVKRIAGILYPDDERLEWTLDELEHIWGKPELVSGAVPFDKTDYYRDIAPRLLRRFACFPGLVGAGGLADWKWQSHELEERSRSRYAPLISTRGISTARGLSSRRRKTTRIAYG